MNRRGFLAVVGSGAAGVTLGSVGLSRLLPSRTSPDGKVLTEGIATSVCGGCPAGCSVRLRLAGGRLVGIQGSPTCPVSEGGLCPRGASEVEAFYDPDRLLGPVRRSGARGANRWERISWDEALSVLAQRLTGLRRSGSAGKVAAVLASGGGVAEAVLNRLLNAYGSPHLYQVNPLRDEAVTAAADLTEGRAQPWTYDLRHTDHLLSFATPVLEGWLSPAWVAAMFGKARGRKHQRLRFVQVDSRLSPTAMRADEWVPVRPGTEIVLAMGIAHLLVTEGRIARGFVERATRGLQGGSDGLGRSQFGFADTLEARYSPELVSRATGVPVFKILRLARDFARARAPLAVGERLAGSAGAFGLGAAQALNALRGRIVALGGTGVVARVPLPSLSAPPPVRKTGLGTPERRLTDPTRVGIEGTSIWRALGALQDQGKPPPFDVLILDDGAALAGLGPGDPAIKALSRISLVISLATGLDASTAVADLVLPSTTRFEQWNDVEPPPAGPAAMLSVSRPALPRLLDGRSVPNTLLALARKLGGGVARALPYKDDAAVIRYRLRGLAKVRRGMPHGGPFQREWTQQMARGGWWTPAATSERKFVSLVLDRGGWIDPWPQPFGAAGAVRYHFDADPARRRSQAASDPLSGPPRTADWFPHPEPGPQKAPADALWVLPFVVGSLVGTGTPNRPSLLEMAGPHVEGAFRPWAEFNPADARRLGLEELGKVEMESPGGRAVFSVRHYEGVPRGSVAVAMGPAGSGAGRWARNWGEGAAGLLGSARGWLTGVPLAAGTWARVRRVWGRAS